MRKIKLEQPFASMVMCGALQTIPDMWGDVKIGEKILVYAGETSRSFFDSPFDCGCELDRKYSNEVFFGNISDTTYLVNEYLGYVIVTSEGCVTEGWPIDTDLFLFVRKPYEFEQKIENYNEDILKLDTIRAHPFPRKKMKRSGDVLYVPVGESAWNEVRDKEQFKNTFVFWESYMNEISPSPWRIDNLDMLCKSIFEVRFCYGSKEIIFEASVGASETGWNMRQYEKKGKKYNVEVFEFYLFDLDVLSKVGFKTNEPSQRKSPRQPWVRIISTPMGGMTKWKRK